MPVKAVNVELSFIFFHHFGTFGRPPFSVRPFKEQNIIYAKGHADVVIGAS